MRYKAYTLWLVFYILMIVFGICIFVYGLFIYPIKAVARRENPTSVSVELPEPPERNVIVYNQQTIVEPQNVGWQVWCLLADEGFPEVGRAAIIGNMKFESALVPYRIENYTLEQSRGYFDNIKDHEYEFENCWKGIGLCQWTGYAQGTKMWKWFSDNGYALDSVEGQVKFLVWDMRERHPDCYARLMNYELEDLVVATADFAHYYERCNEDGISTNTRADYAKQIYAAYCDDMGNARVAGKLQNKINLERRVKAMNEMLGIETDD